MMHNDNIWWLIYAHNQPVCCVLAPHYSSTIAVEVAEHLVESQVHTSKWWAMPITLLSTIGIYMPIRKMEDREVVLEINERIQYMRRNKYRLWEISAVVKIPTNLPKTDSVSFYDYITFSISKFFLLEDEDKERYIQTNAIAAKCYMHNSDLRLVLHDMRECKYGEQEGVLYPMRIYNVSR